MDKMWWIVIAVLVLGVVGYYFIFAGESPLLSAELGSKSVSEQIDVLVSSSSDGDSVSQFNGCMVNYYNELSGCDSQSGDYEICIDNAHEVARDCYQLLEDSQ